MYEKQGKHYGLNKELLHQFKIDTLVKVGADSDCWNAGLSSEENIQLLFENACSVEYQNPQENIQKIYLNILKVFAEATRIAETNSHAQALKYLGIISGKKGKTYLPDIDLAMTYLKLIGRLPDQITIENSGGFPSSTIYISGVDVVSKRDAINKICEKFRPVRLGNGLLKHRVRDYKEIAGHLRF